MPTSVRRILATLFLVIPISIYFWDDLIEQMGGSSLKVILVVSLAIVCGITDVNELVGQPEDHHDD
jgi:hypothetical protein